MKIQKGELRVDRFLIPYRVYGSTGQFIVCVNGAQQTMAAWRSVVSYFFKDHSLILFDFPGQGRAQVLSGPSAISLDEQVEVLDQIVLAQGIPGRFHVVGASWGGVVAAIFASRHPELVDKMILASFGVKTSKRMLDMLEKAKELYESGKDDEVGDLLIESFGQHLSEAHKAKIRHQFFQIEKEHLRAFYEHGRLLANGHNIDEVVDLASIRARTLIINGELDAIVDREDLEIVSTRIPHCETRIVEGVGHFLHNEREEILGIYEEFIARAGELPLAS